MVVVDKLTNATHFMPMKITHTTTNIAKIFMKEIARLHGIPRTIVSDKDTRLPPISGGDCLKDLAQI